MKKKLFITVLFTFCSVYSFAQVSILAPNSSWKYKDNGSNQGTSWRGTSFNDATWVSGNAQLGYGDGDETTVVSYGSNAGNKYITTYFRKSVTISNPSQYSAFILNIMRDDGAVVYINGTERVRTNMPSGTVLYNTLASTAISGTGESAFNAYTLAASYFVNGTNVIAVEIHQNVATSSDISFDLKLDATLAASCGTPASLSAGQVTSNSASLSWSAVSGATSYNVNYRTVGSVSWIATTSTTNSKSLTALAAATAYEFQVQAVCTSTGSFSSPATFTTLTNGNDSLITTNASWKYLDNGTDQGTAWRAAAFNDAAWASGNAELGYGDGGEATVVNYGPNSSNKYITTYFRKSFNVNNPLIYSSLSLGVVRDDGIVVYINGTEVYRNNMPTGTVAYNTLASAGISGADESSWTTVALSISSLIAGSNVIAVEIHQNAVTSSDVSFNARLTAAGNAPPVVTRGAYLQKLSPAEITIRWRTDIACDSRVQFGTSLSYGNAVTDASVTTEHIVKLSGLTPLTKYFYSIGSSTYVLQGDAKNNFYTAPLTGTISPTRIWVTGDFGNGSSQQLAVRNAYMTYTGTTPTNLWLWLGDNAYTTGTDAEYQSNVFNMYPDPLKSYPLYPSPGNHDYAQAGYQSSTSLTTNFPYFSIFSVPQAAEAGGVASGTPKYYSYNYGNIHFISLDSYGSYNTASSPMYQWLNNDLAANSQRWTIVYFHHTPYTMGSHNSDTDSQLSNMRTNIVPLLESYHVDLVLCGHSHVNERSYMIKGHYGLSNSFTPGMKLAASGTTMTKSFPYDGTVYANCGTSGQNPGTVQSGYPMPCMYYNNNSLNCSMVLDVNGDNLNAKYLSSAGNIVDEFTITKTTARIAQNENNVEVNFSPLENMLSITLSLVEDADVTAELVNITGQTIYTYSELSQSQKAGIYNYRLPVDSQFASGIYFLKITANGKVFTKEIAVSR